MTERLFICKLLLDNLHLLSFYQLTEASFTGVMKETYIINIIVDIDTSKTKGCVDPWWKRGSGLTQPTQCTVQIVHSVCEDGNEPCIRGQSFAQCADDEMLCAALSLCEASDAAR